MPSPSGSAVRLAGADILIGGQSVTTLVDPTDTSRVRTMYMDYPAHSSMGMMGYMDRVQLHDDGTHGDQIPGDGIYCYQDVDGHIGPHHDDCPSGEYHYTFHGTDIEGHDTNSIDCRVMVQ